MLTISENAKLLQTLENERQELLDQSNDLTEQMFVLQQSFMSQMRVLSNKQMGLLEKLAKIEETSCKLLKHVV